MRSEVDKVWCGQDSKVKRGREREEAPDTPSSGGQYSATLKTLVISGASLREP